MLIRCPECGKEVSSELKQCIHCNYPITNENNCKINNIQYNLSQELQMVLNNMGTANVIRSLRMKCNLPLVDAKKLYDLINETHKIPDCFDYVSNSNIPKCPTCGSPDISKLGIVNKYVSIRLVGLASNKVAKTFQCKNCGYTW